jgi:hypothetical protein
MSGTKRCRVCGETKPSQQFAFPRGLPSSVCTTCYAGGQAGGAGWPTARMTREMREYHDAVAAQYWQEQSRRVALARRGAHELARQKQIELRRERRKDRWAIVWYFTVALGRALVAFGQFLPRPVIYAVGLLGGGGLGLWLAGWL